MPIPKDSKGLTIKQTKFVKAYVANNGNGQEAAKASYNVKSDAVARTVASETLTLPNVKAAVEAALEKHGITMDKAIKPIADGLEATKFYGSDDSGHMDADHTVRLKASAMALKLMGTDKQEPQGTTFNLNFNKGSGASFDMGKFKK